LSGIAGGLTFYAGTDAWYCAAPTLGYLLATFRAVCLAFTYKHSRTRDHNRVRDGVVDLILNRSVGRPTAGHAYAPHSCLDSANGEFSPSFKVRHSNRDDWIGASDRSDLPKLVRWYSSG
jgi:hypothetical protein